MPSPLTLFQKYKAKLETLYPTLEAEHLIVWLFEEYLELSRKDINSDKQLEAVPAALEIAMDQLMQNKPIQYVTGKAPFYGYKLKVTPDVLIPRNETEELVYMILKENLQPNLRVLDIGTGSGCIPIALSLEMNQAKVYGLDVSAAALAIARENNKLLEAEVEFLLIDILTEMPEINELDIIVSNPPYVRSKEKHQMNANVLDYEPHLALFVADADPLLFYRTIGEKAKKLLIKSGLLYFEINEAMGKETQVLLEALGYSQVEVHQDLNGKDRFVKAIWKG